MAIFDRISQLAEQALSKARSGRGAHIEAHRLEDGPDRAARIVQMVSDLRDEARAVHGPIEQEACDAVHEYMGNQWESQRDTASMLDNQLGTTVLQAHIREYGTDDDLVRPVINRTQNAVLSNTEARTSRPVEIRYEPEETGEPAEFWLTPSAARTLKELRAEAMLDIQKAELAELAQGLGDDGQAVVGDTATPPPDTAAMLDEIDSRYPDLTDRYDEEYGLTEPLTDEEAGMVKELVASGLLSEQDLIVINDDTTASVLQKAISRVNRDALLDAKYLRAANYSTNGGYCFVRFSYNAKGSRKHGVTLENMPIKSVWIDPYHDDISDSDYVGEDRMVSIDRAKVMHPEIPEALLEQAAQEGGPVDRGQPASGYQRRMLKITTCWIRNHIVPVDEARALNEGWVKADRSGEEVEYTLTEDGAEHTGGELGEVVEPQIECKHGTNWPDAEGIRQVVVIDGIEDAVQDIRCPYLDIPYLLFINVPRVDGSPLGQGDAQRLEDIQREINRVAAIIINNQRLAQFPTYFLPQTLQDAVDNTGMGFFLQPGQENVLPDTMFYNIVQSGGFDRMIMNPPNLSGSSMALLEMLMAEHDALSGNVGVRQGRAPQGSSGVAIAQLQEHATGTLALKARLDEHQLTRLGRLEQHAITQWTPETEWSKVASKYPLPVLRRIIQRASNLSCNVRVSVAAGRGIVKQLDKAQAMEMYNSGLATIEDTLAEMEIPDAKQKADKIIQERGGPQAGAAGVGGVSLDQFAPGPQ